MGFWSSFKQAFGLAAVSGTPTITVSDLPGSGFGFTGSKYAGGMSAPKISFSDYWSLRTHSAKLFKENTYARGLIRRLVTNEINEGLHLESQPFERVIGLPEDSLEDWTEDIESRFELWANTAYICDAQERLTFGEIQAVARTEALVEGDVLVMNQTHAATGLPRVRLLPGSCIYTPMGAEPRKGNRIIEGVEVDPQQRQVAYWTTDLDGKAKRIPAWGEKSGKRLAWLYYGTDKRHGEVRGEPLLGIVLQALSEIDRYRDAALRKAVLNSILAMFITREKGTVTKSRLSGGNGGGAVLRGQDTTTGDDGVSRKFKIADYLPGLIIEGLEPGEEPKSFGSGGTDEKFGSFEEAMLRSVAWANGIPPEILLLSFSSNYSASQAAINEFKLYLNPTRTAFGKQFCQPFYEEWLLAQLRARRINAGDLLDAWRDPMRWDEVASWFRSDWSGNIKPSVDPLKLAKAYELHIQMGMLTRGRAARELTGTKFSQNVKRLRKENEQLEEANRALVPATANPTPAPTEPEETTIEEDEAAEAALSLLVA